MGFLTAEVDEGQRMKTTKTKTKYFLSFLCQQFKEIINFGALDFGKTFYLAVCTLPSFLILVMHSLSQILLKISWIDYICLNPLLGLIFCSSMPPVSLGMTPNSFLQSFDNFTLSSTQMSAVYPSLP